MEQVPITFNQLENGEYFTFQGSDNDHCKKFSFGYYMKLNNSELVYISPKQASTTIVVRCQTPIWQPVGANKQ